MLRWCLLKGEKHFRSGARGLARRLDWLPRWALRKLVEGKLVGTLRHVYRNSPTQREHWNAAGIRFGDLGDPHVLQHLPFLNVEALTQRPEDFFCVPGEELIHVIATSGTTSHIKRVFFTNDEMLSQARLIGTSLCRLPGASRCLTTYRFKMPTWPAGFFSWQGIVSAGMLALASGSDAPIDEQIGFIRDYRINVILGVPSYIHRMTLEADADLKSLGVKYFLLCGQPWTEHCRKTIEEAWGAKALDVYATNECGCGLASECIHQNGLHISEADFFVEVIDPATGEPLEDGQTGELVVTTLSRRGMPLVRYRVGDLAHLVPWQGRCECGLPLRKLSRIRGRVDDMLILGAGINVYPDEFDEVIFSVPHVTDYQITLERNVYKEVLHLTVESTSDDATLRETMQRALLKLEAVGDSINTTELLEFGRFERVPVGTLTTHRLKSVRFIDNR